jgi:chromosome segregation ATPase
MNKMGASNELSNHREQISESHQRLIEYVQKITQNFSILQDRLDKIQEQVDKIPTKIAEMSEEIDKLYTIINVHQKDDEFEFVVCTMNMNRFPLDKDCPEFKLEDNIKEQPGNIAS